jgi:transcriptional regulator with XRE-family HTH domain
MDFDKKIIELRKQNNLTQEDLAEKLNVSRQTVSNWETAKCYPDIETLVIISNKFNISLDVLIKENVKMIKDIDKKVRINKKLKYSIFILFLLLVVGVGVICLKNNKVMEVQAKNNELQKEVQEIVEVQKNNSVYSFKIKNINTKDITTNTKKVDIFIDNEVLSKEARVINYYDSEHNVTSDFNKVEYIIVEVPDEDYSNIKFAEVNNKNITIKKAK